MAFSLSIPAPSCLLEHAGNTHVPFPTWLRSVQTYLLAIGGHNFSDARKRAILIQFLGTEGQRIYYSLGSTDETFTGTIATLESYFSARLNVVAERYKFRRRAQQESESVDHFISVLRDLAKTCNFGSLHDEMIRDQLIVKTSVPRIRERLLLTSDLTLEKAQEMAVHIESAMAETRVFQEGLRSASPEFANVHRIQKTSRYQPTGFRDDTSTHRSTDGIRQHRKCYRCGSSSHLANDQRCLAKNATCRSCGKVGHFAKYCRSSHSVREVQEEICITNITSGTEERQINCELEITTTHNACRERFLVDTGSVVSIMAESTYQRHFANAPLMKPSVLLTSYSKERLPVLGCLHARVTYNAISTTAVFYVVRNGDSIMGLDLISAFELHIVGNKLLPPQTPSNDAICPAVQSVNMIGNVKGFVHKVNIKTDVKQMQQKLRRSKKGEDVDKRTCVLQTDSNYRPGHENCVTDCVSNELPTPYVTRRYKSFSVRNAVRSTEESCSKASVFRVRKPWRQRKEKGQFTEPLKMLERRRATGSFTSAQFFRRKGRCYIDELNNVTSSNEVNEVAYGNKNERIRDT